MICVGDSSLPVQDRGRKVKEESERERQLDSSAQHLTKSASVTIIIIKVFI